MGKKNSLPLTRHMTKHMNMYDFDSSPGIKNMSPTIIDIPIAEKLKKRNLGHILIDGCLREPAPDKKKTTSTEMMKRKGFNKKNKAQAIIKILQIDGVLKKINSQLPWIEWKDTILSRLVLLFSMISLALAYSGMANHTMWSADWWKAFLGGSVSFIAGFLSSLYSKQDYGSKITDIKTVNLKMSKLEAYIDTVLNSDAEDMPRASQFVDYYNRKFLKYHSLVPWVNVDETYTKAKLHWMKSQDDLIKLYNSNEHNTDYRDDDEYELKNLVIANSEAVVSSDPLKNFDKDKNDVKQKEHVEIEQKLEIKKKKPKKQKNIPEPQNSTPDDKLQAEDENEDEN